MTNRTYRMWQPPYLPGTSLQPHSRILEWWYRLTTPGVPSSPPGSQAEELVRRERLVSKIVLVELCFLLLQLLFAISLRAPIDICIYLWAIIICGIALSFNRYRYRLIAGLMTVGVSELSILLRLLLHALLPTGQVFDHATNAIALLIQPILLAASLLPIGTIFLLMLSNALFSGVYQLLLIHTAVGMMPHGEPPFLLFVSPMMSLSFVGIIAYFWLESASQVLMRASNAEAVAALEHSMAEQEHLTARKKRILDESIHQITQAHLKVANGDFSARVPLDEEDILWPIAGSLNTLLARIQRLGRQALLLEKTEQEAARVAAALRSMRTGGPPVTVCRNGTAIDLIMLELGTIVKEPVKEAATENQAQLVGGEHISS